MRVGSVDSDLVPIPRHKRSRNHLPVLRDPQLLDGSVVGELSHLGDISAKNLRLKRGRWRRPEFAATRKRKWPHSHEPGIERWFRWPRLAHPGSGRRRPRTGPIDIEAVGLRRSYHFRCDTPADLDPGGEFVPGPACA